MSLLQSLSAQVQIEGEHRYLQVNKLVVFKLNVDDYFGATDVRSARLILYSAGLCHHVSDSNLS